VCLGPVQTPMQAGNSAENNNFLINTLKLLFWHINGEIQLMYSVEINCFKLIDIFKLISSKPII